MISIKPWDAFIGGMGDNLMVDFYVYIKVLILELIFL